MRVNYRILENVERFLTFHKKKDPQVFFSIKRKGEVNYTYIL